MKIHGSNFFIHLGFWVGALVIAVMGWTLYDATTKSNESSAWVTRTYAILQEIGNINAGLRRAESAQRGYLLSGSDAFLAEGDQALAKVREGAARVKNLASDNSVKSLALRLEELITERIAIMQENARRRQTEGIESARKRALSGVGQQASARIYDLTGELEQKERRLLEVRRAAEQRGNELELTILFIAVLLSVIILIPGYAGYILQARARERAERPRP